MLLRRGLFFLVLLSSGLLLSRARADEGAAELAQIESLQRDAALRPRDAVLQGGLARALARYAIRHADGGRRQKEALAAFAAALSEDVDEPLEEIYRLDLKIRLGVLLTVMGRLDDAFLELDSVLGALLPAEREEAPCEGSWPCAQPLLIAEIGYRRAGLVAEAAQHRAEAHVLVAKNLRLATSDFALVTGMFPGLAASVVGIVGVFKEDPSAVPAWSLGRSAAEAVNLAVEACEHVLEATEHEWYGSLAAVISGGVAHGASAALLASVEARGKSQQDTAAVHYVLFDLLRKTKKQEAWAHLELGNAIEKVSRPQFDSARSKQSVDAFRAVFRGNFWQMTRGNRTSKTPVFVIGMARSGSTLVEQILASHPQVHGAGEDSVFNGYLTMTRDMLASNGPPALRIAALDAQAEFIEAKMRSKLPNQKISRVVDKMLFNYVNVGFIHMLFPDAVIIHTRRHYMDTLYSCFKHRFNAPGMEWTNSVDDLASHYADYLRYIEHWNEELPGRVIDVDYESIVVDQEKVARRLISVLDLEWDDACLRFWESNRVVHTNSLTQVRVPIYAKSVGSSNEFRDFFYPQMHAALRKVLSDEQQKRLFTDPHPYYDAVVNNNPAPLKKPEPPRASSSNNIPLKKRAKKTKPQEL